MLHSDCQLRERYRAHMFSSLIPLDIPSLGLLRDTKFQNDGDKRYKTSSKSHECSLMLLLRLGVCILLSFLNYPLFTSKQLLDPPFFHYRVSVMNNAFHGSLIFWDFCSIHLHYGIRVMSLYNGFNTLGSNFKHWIYQAVI